RRIAFLGIAETTASRQFQMNAFAGLQHASALRQEAAAVFADNLAARAVSPSFRASGGVINAIVHGRERYGSGGTHFEFDGLTKAAAIAARPSGIRSQFPLAEQHRRYGFNNL